MVLLVAWHLESQAQNAGTVVAGPPILPDLEAAVRQVFDEDRCVSPPAAALELQQVLADLDLSEWALEVSPAVDPDGCVAPSIDTAQMTVRLLPALPPQVKNALAELTNELIERCLTKQEAINHLTALLTRLGEANFEVRTNGPLAVPLDRVDEVLLHVEAGCWIYSGTGWSEDGLRHYYLSGQ